MPRITPVDWRVLECVFLRAGFKFARQKGSHRIYKRKGCWRPVVFPTPGIIEAPVIKSNLRTAGLSREEYFALLAECQ